MKDFMKDELLNSRTLLKGFTRRKKSENKQPLNVLSKIHRNMLIALSN